MSITGPSLYHRSKTGRRSFAIVQWDNTPSDMRKGFDGLCALVTQGLRREPLSGDISIFVSNDRIREHCSETNTLLYSHLTTTVTRTGRKRIIARTRRAG